jgi:hypothetical protein
MNAAFGPVMISTGLWVGFMLCWCILCVAQAKWDTARGTQYPDHSNG